MKYYCGICEDVKDGYIENINGKQYFICENYHKTLIKEKDEKENT